MSWLFLLRSMSPLSLTHRCQGHCGVWILGGQWRCGFFCTWNISTKWKNLMRKGKTLKHMNKRPLKLQSCPLHSLHTTVVAVFFSWYCVVQCVHPLYRSKGFVMGTDEAKQRLKAGNLHFQTMEHRKQSFYWKQPNTIYTGYSSMWFNTNLLIDFIN